MIRIFLQFALAAAGIFQAAAATAGGIEIVEFADAGQETRYTELIHQLRCLVCQNQSIAESNADLAADMRSVVRQQVVEGQSSEQIVEFLTARYGDFVRYSPPVAARTVVLWFAPFVLAAVALLLVPRLANRRRKAAISESQRADAQRLLAE